MNQSTMSPKTLEQSRQPAAPARQQRESVVVRFAGDSGDGIQLTGSRFAAVTALAGNDLATFPDFPAEIRAPTGTTYGVSAFQINFGARAIKTSGDAPDVLVALNPAALKVELSKLNRGGIVILDAGAFGDRTLRKAGYTANPLEDGSLDGFRTIAIDISKMTLEAVKPFGLSQHEALRCKNLWTLGLVYWMFGRDRQPTRDWVRRRFADEPTLVEAKSAALDAGHAFGETAELEGDIPSFTVAPAPLAPGLYRTITGGEALALGPRRRRASGRPAVVLRLVSDNPGLAVAAHAGRAPSPRRHDLQAEDEIAAVLCRHRRLVRRLARRDLQLRARPRAEERSARPRRRRRAAAGRRQHSTRRPVDRHADEDRTVRSVAGALRAPRREPAGGAGRLGAG